MATDDTHDEKEETGKITFDRAAGKTTGQDESAASQEQGHANNGTTSDDRADGETTSTPSSAESTSKGSRKKAIVGALIAIVALAIVLLIANAMGAFHQHAWAEATCTEPKTCTECGATEGEALGHDYQQTEISPTCTEGGKTQYTCSRCGDTYTEENGEPAIGHTPGEWTVENNQLVQRCTVCNTLLDAHDVTRDDLDSLMASDPVTLDRSYKQTSDSPYKALYPDAIFVDVTNHSDKVVRSANVYLCSWDSNGYPVATAGQFSAAQDCVTLNLNDINLTSGSSWKSSTNQEGLLLNANYTDAISQVRGCVKDVTYMDGSMWVNPYADIWQNLYVSKQL